MGYGNEMHNMIWELIQNFRPGPPPTSEISLEFWEIRYRLRVKHTTICLTQSFATDSQLDKMTDNVLTLLNNKHLLNLCPLISVDSIPGYATEIYAFGHYSFVSVVTGHIKDSNISCLQRTLQARIRVINNAGGGGRL